MLQAFGLTVITANGTNPDLSGVSVGPFRVFGETAPIKASGTFGLS